MTTQGDARLTPVPEQQSAELSRQMAFQRRLLDINQRLLETLDPDGVLEMIADGLKQVVDYDNLAIYRVDPEARLLRPVLARERHAPEVLGHTIAFGRGMTGWAVEQGQPLLVNDALSDPRAIQIPGTPADPEAIIIVPLIARGEVLGVLNMGRVGGPEVYFSQADFEQVQLFAGQAAVALANARLYTDLVRSEARYRFLVDNSPDIVWAVDAAGRCTFVSESLERHTGWRPEQLLGRPFTALVHRDSRATARNAWQAIRDEPSRETSVRLDLRRRDGGLAAVEVTLAAVLEEGRFAGAHGAVRDLTERERLETDLRQQAAALAASEERARLARDLHDSVTQALFSMGLTAHALQLLLERDPAAAGAKLSELQDLQREALAEMRALIFELRPARLEHDGLVQAIKTHAAAVQARTGLEVSVVAEPLERLPLDHEEALYRVAQEALHNVVKHAGPCRARVELGHTEQGVELRVSDDGIGFDPAAVDGGRLGLAGMRQRAERIGARLAVDARPGGGTVVSLSLPVDAGRQSRPGAASAE
ncbi:MAG TPA: PAS domain S-box protein [Candidatus Limnocylindria bacterium]|nr:PAS domain S-box protein [Candidatus Limnocylindria bacterium]